MSKCSTILLLQDEPSDHPSGGDALHPLSERGAVLDTDRRPHPDRNPEGGLQPTQTPFRPWEHPAGGVCHEDQTGKAVRIGSEINPSTLPCPGGKMGLSSRSAAASCWLEVDAL
jgi:hypothetical protein